jgi:hypothetical protein
MGVISTFKFSISFSVQQHFTNSRAFGGNECVEVLDKYVFLSLEDSGEVQESEQIRLFLFGLFSSGNLFLCSFAICLLF